MLQGWIVNNQCNNKIMIEKSTKNNKQRHFKTEVFHQSQCLPFQFGKPIVKLPIINKKSGALKFRYDNTIDKSLDSKQKSSIGKASSLKQDSCMCLNVQELILRKYSNNSQLQLLTFEQLQLCSDISKKILPKIAAMGAPSRQNTDRSLNDQYHKRLIRIKSEKKIDSNTSQLGIYKLGAIIGRGNYSVVRLCQTNQGKRYAAKVYSKQKINCSQREENLKQQISILKFMNHPNVISFKEHIETEQSHYIIMQVFDNISLINYIKKQSILEQKQDNTGLSSEPCTSRYKQKARLNQGSAKVIMKKILQAFAYIHENGIAHRDVKLQNILVASQGKDQIEIKVIDFGFSRRCLFEKQADVNLSQMKQNKRQFNRKSSKILQQEIFYDYCGTPSYISPEINQKRGYLARPSDVWALGVMFFYMVTGNFPFKNITQKSDFNNSIYQQLNSNIKISPPLTLMLKKMLRNDPLSRPTVKQLLLKQQWLNCQF